MKFYSKWYEENRERLLPIRRAYNAKYTKKPENILRAKERNATPEAKAKRKAYKQTKSGKEAARKYQKKNWDKILKRVQKNRLKYRYGLTLEEFEEMKKKYPVCPICTSKDRKFHIDHSHSTGKVRGLLCTCCNMALGLLKDDIKVLRKAIEYLEKWQAEDQ